MCSPRCTIIKSKYNDERREADGDNCFPFLYLHLQMHLIFTFITESRYSKDKSKIRSLLRDNPGFRALRREAAMVIDEYTNMEFIFDEEESVNMCEGVQGMIDDAVEEAMEKQWRKKFPLHLPHK